MREASPKTIYLKDYTVPDYLIDRVNLRFELDADNTQVHSELTIRRNPDSQNANAPLVLLGEQLQLISLMLDDKTPDYQQTGESLTLPGVPQDGAFVLRIHNQINPAANTALEGLYLSNGMLCTQCEAEGFRKITYFLDRPDVMSRFTSTLVADKTRYPVLLCNGNKVDSGDLDGNRHFVTWEDPFAKPCYLFALVAGQLECLADSYTTASGRDVALQIFVEAHDIDKCEHAMQSLKNAMRWDEQVYGLEYDLDLYMIVAVGHFNMGAMENKGLNVFNTKFVLARPDTATDSDYEHIEGVIGHEYFHNWSGNRVTCRDWFQLSLKEGFTVFRDQEFTADQTSRGVKRIEDVNLLRTRQFAEDAGPLAHPIRPEAYIEINNFYTVTVYEKGAEVVRMLHTLLGADGFRQGCDLYFARHDGQAVTCDDFVNAMETANGVDLTQFRRWYSQAGTPRVSVSQQYDAAAQTLSVTLRQSCPATPNQPHKLPLHIPVRVGLLNADGSAANIDLAGFANQPGLAEVTLELTESEQTFVFQNLPAKPVVSLLRGFSAPVNLEMERGLDEWAFLLSHDSDSFNRWEAAQQLAAQVIFDLVAGIQAGENRAVPDSAIAAFGAVLAQDWDDLSYFALLLTLPDMNYLAGLMTVVDVDALHQARVQLKTTLAQALQSQFAALYQRYHRDESGDFSAAAIGRRRVKNVALSYLVALEQAQAYELAAAQFAGAGNMTDQQAALAMIVHSQHPDKAACLAQFYQQWQGEALVIDKWFTLQATSPTADTPATVAALLQHPAFDLKNPNRVRSLVGAFSQSNLLHFHATTGAGYAFLADQVIALDALNPQVASRMVSALTSWHRYDAVRQVLMKAQLQRIVDTPNISRDVFEVAGKSLG